MNVVIRDAAALRTVQLSAIRQYLANRGWQVEPQPTEQTDQPLRAIAWAREVVGQGRIEVLVPTSEALRDYPHRIADLLTILATSEQQSQLAIFRTWTRGRLFDRLRWVVFVYPVAAAVVLAVAFYRETNDTRSIAVLLTTAGILHLHLVLLWVLEDTRYSDERVFADQRMQDNE